ncbi:hypothetical protein [uncultured Tateyamaria sp.]|uniref:DUF7742 family protein n=1 Tax=uncultured Tateyamaria sp. TaxID=455651 RepID=UPI00262779EE|nr:hypothetical protein [uncultured Tateyamaria sp.]
MRPVLASDLLCAGRAVLAAAPEARAALAGRLLQDADAADIFCQREGARHPDFGDGTLAAAARGVGLAAEPTICDRDFAHALVLVLMALIYHARDD